MTFEPGGDELDDEIDILVQLGIEEEFRVIKFGLKSRRAFSTFFRLPNPSSLIYLPKCELYSFVKHQIKISFHIPDKEKGKRKKKVS